MQLGFRHSTHDDFYGINKSPNKDLENILDEDEFSNDHLSYQNSQPQYKNDPYYEEPSMQDAGTLEYELEKELTS